MVAWFHRFWSVVRWNIIDMCERGNLHPSRPGLWGNNASLSFMSMVPFTKLHPLKYLLPDDSTAG